MGYERWLPTPPKVEKPRTVYNAATLAYIGDCIYEVVLYTFSLVILIRCSYLNCNVSCNLQLYARRHFLFPPLSIDEYNERVTSVVRCEAQV